ncbi:VOC family protein [Chelatococcus asaccharovorans]|uniref:Catechol 2,3-dioxygenase-like lactoylglutathione lyase family enzyme n=1 Tax=Chelatococcus asaccharovorans TaxID=28210 RepID=A0A2V3TWW8_9HYPH|nr:VOC family protein [Chelatococcus asaccharovorans]MBS7705174.1 VOC family protein [Chelatococcus asaccharovorans]PXW53671.1 catechol 2,3-dioxygenase-like lactoylglutathione lyase family enzyme [Chelatococcus asaccharovorans]
MGQNALHEKARTGSSYMDPTKRAYRTAEVDVTILKHAKDDNVELRLYGVDHSARPTWKLRDTVTFYRDVLGLPLIHTISARGWGQPGHPDFLHFFFDAGNGATIAFFYYIGTERPERYLPEDSHFYSASHTAWGVESMEQLVEWKETLEARGIVVSNYTRHEGLESIYFRDPNGYPLEITLRLRDVEEIDAKDAELTLEAAMQIEDEARAANEKMTDIDTIWRRKAKIVESYLGEA